MKNTLKSKTIWFNILSIIVGMATLYTPLIDAWITDDVVKVKVLQSIIFINGVVNLVLRRFFTSEKLTESV